MNNIDDYYNNNWLSLEDGEKFKLFHSWNTQEGDGFPIAIITLARLVVFICSDYKVGHANIGIYHGGTYLLKICLAQHSLLPETNALPPAFEGFPVIWTNFKNEWIGGFRMGGL